MPSGSASSAGERSAAFVLAGSPAPVCSGLSVVFGVLTAIAPGAGALALVLWIGAYAIVFGMLLVAFAFRLRRAGAAVRPPLARAA